MMDAWRAHCWRRKKAAWRRARYPELWSPRARLKLYGQLAWFAVWKGVWFEPLLLLHRAGVITWEQFEEAAMAPARRDD